MRDDLILQLNPPNIQELVLGQGTALALTIPNGSGGNTNVIMDTTANWALRTEYVPKRATIIVYSDRFVVSGQDVPGIKIGDGVTVVGDLPFVSDNQDVTYAMLPDKPSINHVTLVGNLQLADLFPDGIIINGGDSTGYTPPVVPTGVPYAEGVMF